MHTAQVMPLPLTVSCFSKIQIGFTFLVLAHPGSPGQRAVKWVCVCVFVVTCKSKHKAQTTTGVLASTFLHPPAITSMDNYMLSSGVASIGPRPLIRQVRPGSAFRTMPVKLILRKIMKTVAIRCHILHLACTKFDFGCGSAPDPTGGAYSWI